MNCFNKDNFITAYEHVLIAFCLSHVIIPLALHNIYKVILTFSSLCKVR